ncbi:hypothetical protein F4692_003771 [Nocardioides cavernae]|uniref:Uncharacterized protein n=1 Tax=Nocardioides cavernae TaxID=1921566 RepID=A0A7Y9KRC7_9ACTN|nr:hypothetical protein [Nocardioides cavernae]
MPAAVPSRASGRKRDPVTRLAANLMQVEAWARKGKVDRARDMLQACKILHLPAVPEELREPWERRIRLLDERLPETSWDPSGPSSPDAPHTRRQERTRPTPTSTDVVAAESVAVRSPVWERLARALDDRRTEAATLTISEFQARFDYVAAESGVQVWATLRNAPRAAWSAHHESRFIREARAIAPSALGLVPVHTAPDVDASAWLLVWAFTSIPDARVAVKSQFLEASPDTAPELKVERHPVAAVAEFDRAVERLGSRQYRPGQGRKRFAVTSCARCGQPLSDPNSLILGIGPDCLKYFDPTVLVAAKQWKPGSVRAVGRTINNFLAAVTGDW